MLKQATVEDISKRRIVKLHGQIVVVTRYYPRFLKRPLIHDYIGDLAPVKTLLEEFKERERESGDHDGAFEAIHYQEKFRLSQEGLAQLARLAEASVSKDVYLVCHCAIGQRCHRELLMLIAAKNYGAKIARVYHTYPIFETRMKEQEIEL